MALHALKRQPAEQMAAEALREAILSGVIKPGERLTEIDLSEQFGVSRGTVRLALHQLSSDGLVILKPYSGWSVISFEPRDLWEIYTVRGGLEGMAARLAAEQIDDAGTSKLEKAAQDLFDAARNGMPPEEIKSRDFALHRCIVEMSRNSRLENHYRLVEQQVRMFISFTYNVNHRTTVIEHHTPIVEAILRRKPRLASQLSERHCIEEGERVLREFTVEGTLNHE